MSNFQFHIAKFKNMDWPPEEKRQARWKHRDFGEHAVVAEMAEKHGAGSVYEAVRCYTPTSKLTSRDLANLRTQCLFLGDEDLEKKFRYLLLLKCGFATNPYRLANAE